MLGEISRWMLWLKEFLQRPRCFLIGCRAGDFEGYLSTSCVRCGAGLYEGFIDASICDPVQRRWWAFRAWLKPRRCERCGKRMGYRNTDPTGFNFCSSECEENWIPF
jgi:uncharacterized protein (DUF983 family)